MIDDKLDKLFSQDNVNNVIEQIQLVEAMYTDKGTDPNMELKDLVQKALDMKSSR